MSQDREKEELRNQIRRQFVSPATAKFLQALPPFKIDPGIPDRFNRLLGELDRTERERRRMDGRQGS